MYSGKIYIHKRILRDGTETLVNIDANAFGFRDDYLLNNLRGRDLNYEMNKIEEEINKQEYKFEPKFEFEVPKTKFTETKYTKTEDIEKGYNKERIRITEKIQVDEEPRRAKKKLSDTEDEEDLGRHFFYKWIREIIQYIKNIKL